MRSEPHPAPNMASSSQAEVLLSSSDLSKDMEFFKSIGFKLTSIYPADDPAVARMHGHEMRIRLDRKAASPSSSVIINILTDRPRDFTDGKSELVAPNGTIVKLLSKTFRLEVPETRHAFLVSRLSEGKWTNGRAGMLYRDLIPCRLGGVITASHISIPAGGPVPDMVHFHTINFQLIYCYKGWVKVVYEDQGPPFILEEGDCVTQPPEIRHRVLESSENLEVIEIGVPTKHMTTIDHEMELPTGELRPDREFSGQTFCHHQLKKAKWSPWQMEEFEFRETGVGTATKGLASVHCVRVLGVTSSAKQTNPPLMLSHTSDIYFAFVLKGELELYLDEGLGVHSLKASDAYVVPPGVSYQINKFSSDLEFLEVTIAKQNS